MNATAELHVRCVVAGGGPAGMMLGFLLARAGIEVVVLEKHADFFRDFRGDTIHPSTLELLYELSLLDEFLKLPHQEVRQLRAHVGDETVTVADFTHVPTHCKFLALMPQWDFLNFLASHARRYPTFRLMMESAVDDLVVEDGCVRGVSVASRGSRFEIRADLVVGADGRSSTVRKKAGLEVMTLGAPMDVLWMRLSRRPGDPEGGLGWVNNGRILVLLDRGDYFQSGLVIRKGGFAEIQRSGLPAFRADLARLVPFLRDRVDELRDWQDIRLLTVMVDRLRRWYRPGLLCIGDAAHAMSPIGGVGINLAIQDAVAAANVLAGPLATGPVALKTLQAIQRRRELPTAVTQRAQVFIQNQVIRRVLSSASAVTAPWPLRLLDRYPVLRRIPARLVGVGVRPEHVRTPELA